MKRAKVLALATIPMALAIGFSVTGVASAAEGHPNGAKPVGQPNAAKPVGQPNAAKPMPQSPGAKPLAFGDGVAIAPGDWNGASVSCPDGAAPLSGGGATSDTDIFLTDSFATGNGWFVGGRNTGDSDQTLFPYVLCTAP